MTFLRPLCGADPSVGLAPHCAADAGDPYRLPVACSDPATVAAHAVFTAHAPERLGRLVRLCVLPPRVVERLSFRRCFDELGRREYLVERA